MNQEIVLVTGATGMIGRAVLPVLQAAGYRVRGLARIIPNVLNNVEWIQGDMTDSGTVERAMQGVSAVIHLAAAKNDEPESQAINVEGATHLKNAAEKAGVKRIINISTQSTKLPSRGVYGQTKLEADTILQSSPIPVTTFLCSIVYGEKTDGIVGSIVGFSGLAFFPVIGPGTPRFRPMHRDDLAQVILEALRNDATKNKIYDIGGLDLLSFDALADRILEAQGLRKKHVHLPIPIAMLLARIFSFMKKPPVTISNVRGSAVDVPMDMSAFERDFQTRPRSLETGLATLFPVDDMRRIEAAILLKYVLPVAWTPDEAVIDRYLAALEKHGVSGTPTLDARVRTSTVLLRAIDLGSKDRYPHGTFRKKLTVAAAIAECTPASADALLPKDRSRIAVCGQLLMIGIGSIEASILGRLLSSSFLQRNAL